MATARPMKSMVKVVPLEGSPGLDRVLSLIDKPRIRRVADTGCHRGEHIRDFLRPCFPDAEIVGIEPKNENFAECLKLNIDRVNFLQLDCRALSKHDVGFCDFVWSGGLLYHLDDPTIFMKS